MKKILLILILSLFFLCGCTTKNQTNNNKKDEANVNIESKQKEVMDYLSTVDQSITDNTEEESKNNFEKIINFIFNDGKINEVTFKELSLNTQKEIIEYSLKIDKSIENKWPNYKETIKGAQSDIFNGISSKLEQELDNLNKKLKDTFGQDVYDETKESLKEQTSNAGKVLKDIGNELKEIGKDIIISFKNVFNK